MAGYCIKMIQECLKTSKMTVKPLLFPIIGLKLVKFGIRNIRIFGGQISGYIRDPDITNFEYSSNPYLTYLVSWMYLKYLGAKVWNDWNSNLDICFKMNRSSLVLKKAMPDLPPDASQFLHSEMDAIKSADVVGS